MNSEPMNRRSFLAAAVPAVAAVQLPQVAAAEDTPVCEGSHRDHNHPLHEKALIHLWGAIEACEGLIAQHRDCDDPDCYVCRDDLCAVYGDLQGMLYTLELYASCLDGAALPFLEQAQHRRKEALSRGGANFWDGAIAELKAAKGGQHVQS